MGSTDWRVAMINQTSNASAEWSPDGEHLLIEVFNSPDESPIALVDSTGRMIRRYQGFTFATWVDAKRFVLLSYPKKNQDQQAAARLGTVESANLAPVDVPSGDPLSNGHGAVAFLSSGCDIGCSTWTYSVWTPETGASERQPGEPLAWSPAGDRLFVLHPDPENGPPHGAPGSSESHGWLEVLAWPGLVSIAQLRDVTLNDDLTTVDPSGRYLTNLADDGDTMEVIDADEGAVTQFGIASWASAWSGEDVVVGPHQVPPVATSDPAGDSLTAVPVRGPATVLSIEGDTVATWDNVGSYVTGSQDGSTVVFWDGAFSDARSFVTVVANGHRSEIEPIPLDGYVTGCNEGSVAPSDQDVVFECSVRHRYSDQYDLVTLLHRL